MYGEKQFRSTSSIPEFLIFTPAEDGDTDPCLSWYPDPQVQGLPNETKTPLISSINAMIQIISCLPEINNELPVSHANKTTEIFTKCIHGLHMDSKVPQINQDESKTEDFRELLTILREEISKGVQSEDYIKMYEIFMFKIIRNTRFGKRFNMKPNYYLTIDINLLTRNSTLIELLNGMYNLPSLFFGGRPPPKMERQPLIEELPSFVTILFNRYKDGKLCDTLLEIPYEMDMGKFCTIDCKKPFAGYGYKGSPTFCRLHGFVTQKKGKYYVYSRTRSGSKWFRICDEQVENVEMGMSIESKGILMAIYR